MSMSIFRNYLVTVLINKPLRCIVRHGTPVYKRPWAYYINCVLWSKCVYYTRLWIHWFHDLDATIPNDSVTLGRMSLVGVGHSGSDSIVLLMLCMVCCTMAGALALYYRSLRTASTLLRRSNISGRPYMGVMTYKVLAFFAFKRLGNYCRFYTISFENPKTIKWCISGGNALFLGYYSKYTFTFTNWAHVIPKCGVYLLSR
jgi:hypothetical protein